MDSTKKAVLMLYGAYELIQKRHLVVLERHTKLFNATLGTLLVDGQEFETIELPWLENRRNVSCIPTGCYALSKITRSNGKIGYWLRDVDGRSEILIHTGTKPEHSKGCILINPVDFKKFIKLVPNKSFIVIR